MDKKDNHTQSSGTEMSDREYIERIRLLYASTIPAFVAIVVSSTLLSYILSDSLPQLQVYTWMIYMLSVGMLRVFVYFKFKRNEANNSKAAWRNGYVMLALMTGLGWAFVGLFFLPQLAPVYQLTVVVIIVSYLAGAMTTQFPLAISFYSIFLPPSLSLIYVFVMQGGELNNILVFMLTIFILFVISATKRLRATLINSLLTGFENESLAHHLTLEKKASDNLNKSLKEEIKVKKQAEAGLIEAKIQAEKANEAKSVFLSTISHELRTPMNGIIGCSSIIADMDSMPKIKSYINTINKSAHDLNNLINNMLSYSDLESGRLKPEFIEFSLNDLVRKYTRKMGAEAQQKEITFIADISKKIPGYLIGDPAHLEQILNIFGENAIKYTSQGEIRFTILIDEENSEFISLQFSSKDTGIGITQDKQKALFQAFTQIDGSTTRQYSGIGLGLNLAKSLIDLLGGKIWMESETDAGSTFYFTARFRKPASGEMYYQSTSSDISTTNDVKSSAEPAKLAELSGADKQALTPLMLQLNKFISEYDIESENTLLEIEPKLENTKYYHTFQLIKLAIKKYDFDKAKRQLELLSEELGVLGSE